MEFNAALMRFALGSRRTAATANALNCGNRVLISRPLKTITPIYPNMPLMVIASMIKRGAFPRTLDIFSVSTAFFAYFEYSCTKKFSLCATFTSLIPAIDCKIHVFATALLY